MTREEKIEEKILVKIKTSLGLLTRERVKETAKEIASLPLDVPTEEEIKKQSLQFVANKDMAYEMIIWNAGATWAIDNILKRNK